MVMSQQASPTLGILTCWIITPQDCGTLSYTCREDKHTGNIPRDMYHNLDRKGGGDISWVFIGAVLAEQTLTHSVRAVKTSPFKSHRKKGFWHWSQLPAWFVRFKDKWLSWFYENTMSYGNYSTLYVSGRAGTWWWSRDHYHLSMPHYTGRGFSQQMRGEAMGLRDTRLFHLNMQHRPSLRARLGPEAKAI